MHEGLMAVSGKLTGSDGLLQVRIGRSGQQAGRALDHAITYRGSRFKYFNQAR